MSSSFPGPAPLAVLVLSLVGCGSGGFGAGDAGPNGAIGEPEGGVFVDGGTKPTCGRWVQRRYLPGADGVLGTTDDVLEPKARIQEIGANDTVIRETVFGAPGADGQWGTADDVIEQDLRFVSVGPDAIDLVAFAGPGADGQWGTDDDVVGGYSAGKLAGGRVIELQTFTGAGPDAKWRTADDVRSSRYRYAYGDGITAPRVRADNFVGPGADSQWGTADDLLGMVTSRWPDWGVFSTAPGPDGVWGSKDDLGTGRYVDLRNPKPGVVQYLEMWRTGPDEKVFTADDWMHGLATIACKDGIRDSRIHDSPGPDAVWGTADDVVSTRVRIEGCLGCDGDLPTSPLDPR